MTKRIPLKSNTRSGANMPGHLLNSVTPHDLACIGTVYGLDAMDKTPQQLAEEICGDVGGAAKTAVRTISDTGHYGQGYWTRTMLEYLNQDRPQFLITTVAAAALWAVLTVLMFLCGVDKDTLRAARKGLKRSIKWRTWITLIMLGLLAFVLVWIMLWQEKTPRYSNRNRQAELLGEMVIKGTGGKMSALHAAAVHALSPGDIYTRDMEHIFVPRPLAFPADHDMHLEWPTEWWYFAINMTTEDGTPCSVLLLIMRQRVSGLDKHAQVYMVTGGVTLGTKRISKLFPSVVQGMAPMVTHGTDPVQMTVGVQGFVSHSPDPAKTIFPCTFTFKDGHSNVELDLTLSNDKYPHDENRLLQFNNGFVAAPLKGTGLGQLYYSYPNVVAQGSLTTADAKTPVSGTAWIDHQGGGAGSPADYRLPGYWARVLAGAAGAPPAKVTLSREGGTQWRWFAVHMDEADGTRSHVTLALRADAASLEDARMFPGDMAGKMFIEKTGEFVEVGETNMRVEKVVPGTLDGNGAVGLPSEWTVRILHPPVAARTIRMKLQTPDDPCDMHYGTPNFFAEAPCDVWWTPAGHGASSMMGPPNGVAFCETVGAGGTSAQFSPFLKMLGLLEDEEKRSAWIEGDD
jgi:hypothetical protein